MNVNFVAVRAIHPRNPKKRKARSRHMRERMVRSPSSSSSAMDARLAAEAGSVLVKGMAAKGMVRSIPLRKMIVPPSFFPMGPVARIWSLGREIFLQIFSVFSQVRSRIRQVFFERVALAIFWGSQGQGWFLSIWYPRQARDTPAAMARGPSGMGCTKGREWMRVRSGNPSFLTSFRISLTCTGCVSDFLRRFSRIPMSFAWCSTGFSFLVLQSSLEVAMISEQFGKS